MKFSLQCSVLSYSVIAEQESDPLWKLSESTDFDAVTICIDASDSLFSSSITC